MYFHVSLWVHQAYVGGKSSIGIDSIINKNNTVDTLPAQQRYGRATHPKNHVKLNFNPWQDLGECIFCAWVNFILSGSGRTIPNFSFNIFLFCSSAVAGCELKLFILFTVAWIYAMNFIKLFDLHIVSLFSSICSVKLKARKTCASYNDTWKLAVEKLVKIFHQHRAVNVKVIAWNFALTQSVAVSSNQSQRHPNSASIIIWMYKFASLTTFSSQHHHPRNHQQ